MKTMADEWVTGVHMAVGGNASSPLATGDPGGENKDTQRWHVGSGV